MDDQHFDGLARAIASGMSRRQVVKAVLGLGAVSGATAVGLDTAEAARRGYAGPPTLGQPLGRHKEICVGDCCFVCNNLPTGTTEKDVQNVIQQCLKWGSCRECFAEVVGMSCERP